MICNSPIRRLSSYPWHPAIWAVLLIALTAALAWPQPLCRAQQPAFELYEASGTTMGKIEYKVLVPHHDRATAEATTQGVAELLKQINESMSTYLPESEVSRFNTSQSTDWFAVSWPTARVVHRGLEISAASNGAFDMTVKRLVDRWSFGATTRDFTIPSDDEIADLLKSMGYWHLEVRLEPPAIKKAIPELQIDLSAIAKGYAVDQVAEYLESKNLMNYFVEIGGEVRVRGLRPDGLAWRIGIERPVDDRREAQQIIKMESGSLASSGSYRNYWEFQGRRYSHTIDPSTGFPIDHRLVAVSVLAADCTTADALATAVMVLGRERGTALCQQFAAELLTLSSTDTGQISEWSSAGFPASVEVHSPPPQGVHWGGALLGAAVIFALAIAAMAVGVMFGRRPISGSCGGLANSEGGCSLCGDRAEDCEQRGAKPATSTGTRRE